ncbi:MAG: VTT domain-containing protein [Roseburia sp.]|nr:VTT domain-containing protein [Roseburia sp.]MCM1277665.1 VTT domain-containing protein [Robinsoniella sp.]
MNTSNVLKNIKWLVTILAALTILFMVYVIIDGYIQGCFVSREAFEAYIDGFGVAAPAVFVLFQAIQVVIPVLPGFIGCAAGAGVFGPVAGFLYNYTGICAGSIIAFLLARRFGVQLVKKMISEEKYNKYADKADNSKGFVTVFLLTILLPLGPDDVFCYLAGLTQMNFKKFCLILFWAKPWCILLYSIGFGLLFQ